MMLVMCVGYFMLISYRLCIIY